MEEIPITIVGAGVVGLAVGLELSKSCRDIFIIEKNYSFGQETSSRNSEVIHAGIYYPKDSLKTKTCIEGRRLLYEFCAKNNITHKRIGKLIVAINENEIKELQVLFQQGLENGIKELQWFSKKEIKEREPYIDAQAAVYSPVTGILDTHGFMKHMAWQFSEQGGQISCNTEVIGIDKTSGGFEITVKEASGEVFKFLSRVLINSAGLYSDKIAAMAGLTKDEYTLRYCKGDYFRVQPNKARYLSHLVYPVPKKDRAGLGIHATLDLGGGLRLGPDDEYVDSLEYAVSESKKQLFYESVRQYLPFMQPDDLATDTSGIRPKLQRPGEDFRDFVIQDESEDNLPGLINLIGIESPGLTSSLSIARLVKDMVKI